MSSQHKATLRKSLQSALAHRRLANVILDSIVDMQSKLNATLDKLDADGSTGSPAVPAIAEVTEIKVVADVSGSLDGTWFLMNEVAGSVAVWINISGSTPEPAHGADRSIEVATIAADDSADDVAAKIAAALDADAGFEAEATADTVTVTNVVAGDVDDAEDGTDPTGFSFTITEQGADAVPSDIAIEEDYEDGAIAAPFKADAYYLPGQHKATLRRVMRSVLKHKKVADELADAMEEVQLAYNTMLAKLDAEGGTLASTDFASTLAVAVIDAETGVRPGPHLATVRKTLRNAMSHRRLADTILDAIIGVQDALNATLAMLDTGLINGNAANLKVEPLQPEA